MVVDIHRIAAKMAGIDTEVALRSPGIILAVIGISIHRIKA